MTKLSRPPLGAEVCWTSSSNGVTTSYRGVVIYSGLPLCSRRARLIPEEVDRAPVSHVHFDAVNVGDHRSYTDEGEYPALLRAEVDAKVGNRRMMKTPVPKPLTYDDRALGAVSALTLALREQPRPKNQRELIRRAQQYSGGVLSVAEISAALDAIKDLVCLRFESPI